MVLVCNRLQMWTSACTCQIFAKMESVSTTMEAIGVNVRWDTSLMQLERSVLVSARKHFLRVY